MQLRSRGCPLKLHSNVTYRAIHARHHLLVNGQRELRGQRAVCGGLGLHQITLILKRFCLALGEELANSLRREEDFVIPLTVTTRKRKAGVNCTYKILEEANSCLENLTLFSHRNNIILYLAFCENVAERSWFSHEQEM